MSSFTRYYLRPAKSAQPICPALADHNLIWLFEKADRLRDGGLTGPTSQLLFN